MRNRFNKLFIYIFPAVLIVLLNVLARRVTGFGEWYATTVYPFFVNIVARVLSPLPFSVVEFGLYALILAALFFLVRGIWQVAGRRRRAFDFARSYLGKALLLVEFLLLIYTLTCGINYHRLPFSTLEGFDIQKSSTEELAGLCRALAEELRTLEPQISRDAAGLAVMPEDIAGAAQTAMSDLGKQYASLSGYYPRPKQLVVSEILSYQHISGVYSPFTVEANVNADMVPYNVMVTMCHELSHLTGFMREDEANFLAYLACHESDTPALRYGGALFAYIYAANALLREDVDTWREIRALLPEGAIADLAANSAFWDRYDGKIAEVSNKVNDTYLKLNDQKDGVKSYGRMVDLLLAEYRADQTP